MDSPSNEDNLLRIYASDNEMVQKVCQLLSTPKSNKIYNVCMNDQLNAKEIAKIIDDTDNPRLPGYVVHLKNMVEVGLLRVEEKKQRKKGHVLKFYKSVPFVIIVPPQHVEKVKNSKTLRNTFRSVFKDGIKFAGVGFALVSSWFLSRQIYQKNGDGLESSGESTSTLEWIYQNYEIWIPLVGLSTIILMLIILKKKNI